MRESLLADFELPIVLHVEERHRTKVRYVLDTLMMAAGVAVRYTDEPPAAGPWLCHEPLDGSGPLSGRCLRLAYCRRSWDFFDGAEDVTHARCIDDVPVVLAPPGAAAPHVAQVSFDLPANAFYFLASWAERRGNGARQTRQLHATSVFARLGLPQDIVDRYLRLLLGRLSSLCTRLHGSIPAFGVRWPDDARFAVVLSHDVDFLPGGPRDVAAQGVRTLMRHLVRHRDPVDAARAMLGLGRCIARGRDPYGCVPAIIAGEQKRGVRSSFQVAVARRHPADVNYDVGQARTRAYLRTIVDAGFDLCLHGSYRSTENPAWYGEEVERLARCLQRPFGSRQHYLSFDYDALFAAQERSGIRYDMSMGFPDRSGARSGFSFPYFPYSLDEDRPYGVLEIGLFLMDATLRGYMGVKGASAWRVIEATLEDLRAGGGCGSVVWHPIVFGGARDPGYDRLYWRLVDTVTRSGGLATDGATIARFWRARSLAYPSFRRP